MAPQTYDRGDPLANLGRKPKLLLDEVCPRVL